MRGVRGFTLMELLVVLALIAILASLVAPVVSTSIVRAKEATLKEDLMVMRKAIDDYYMDAGSYPSDLNLLIVKRYIRKLPVDPITERADTWVEIREEQADAEQAGIVDVRSGADAQSVDGEQYRDW